MGWRNEVHADLGLECDGGGGSGVVCAAGAGICACLGQAGGDADGGGLVPESYTDALTLQQIGNRRERNSYWYLTEIFRNSPAGPGINGEPYYSTPVHYRRTGGFLRLLDTANITLRTFAQ